ncbi:MAG: ribonuclease H-like domain-containing protein [Firmicutes bacterium]|nr:ribonuclease H-like domain-containing protein [Bacillota bacterium]MBR6352143.1 ribonuclease H-like domain-containing protein [Bacillota bacterium]
MKYDPYSENLNVKVFDIETMGLWPTHDMVINAGFVGLPGKELFQNFAEDPSDEKRILEEILGILEECDEVITYNGERFDLPFVLARAKKYRLCEKLPLFKSVDVYRRLKQYWPLAKSMQSLSQKSVEEAMGLAPARSDKIPGGECIPLYNRYLAVGDKKAKETILLHNADDVRQLAAITDKLSFLPYHEIAFKEGFIAKAADLKLRVRSVSFEGSRLHSEGVTKSGLLPVSVFEDSFRFDYDSFTGRFTMDVFSEERDGMLFSDLKLLPVEAGKLKDLGGYHSGFLLLEENGSVQYAEANALVRAVLEYIFNY